MLDRIGRPQRQRLAITLDGLIGPALRVQGDGHVSEQRAAGRSQFETLTTELERFVGLAGLVVNDGQSGIRLGIVGLQAQGLLKGRDRLVAHVARREHAAAIEMRNRRVRIRGQGPIEAGQRLVQPSLTLQQRAVSQQSLEMIRLAAEHVAIRSLGGGRLAPHDGDIGQVAPRLVEIRPQSQRVLVAGRGPVPIENSLASIAQVEMQIPPPRAAIAPRAAVRRSLRCNTPWSTSAAARLPIAST